MHAYFSGTEFCLLAPEALIQQRLRAFMTLKVSVGYPALPGLDTLRGKGKVWSTVLPTGTPWRLQGHLWLVLQPLTYPGQGKMKR